jgi:hypothetical protein
MSAFDLQAVDPIIETIKDAGKPYLVILNECDSRSSKMAETAMEVLSEDGHKVAAQRILQRTSYRAAATGGMTGPEV